MSFDLNIHLRVPCADITAVATALTATLGAVPGAKLHGASLFGPDDLLGPMVPATVDTSAERAAQAPQAGEPQPDTQPAPEEKARRTRKKSAPAEGQGEPQGEPQAPATPDGLLKPLAGRTATDEKGAVVATEDMFFYVEKYDSPYRVRPGEPLVIMSGAVEITEDEYGSRVAERAAKAQAKGNAGAEAPAGTSSGAGNTDAPAREKTTAESPAGAAAPAEVKVEALRDASAAAVAAGKRAEVLALVKKYDTQSISTTPPEKRAAMLADLLALVPSAEDDSALA